MKFYINEIEVGYDEAKKHKGKIAIKTPYFYREVESINVKFFTRVRGIVGKGQVRFKAVLFTDGVIIFSNSLIPYDILGEEELEKVVEKGVLEWQQ